jgi:hypothetical protein
VEILFAVTVIFVGSFVQSSIGFGLAIIAAPLLYFIDPLYVPAPITVCALTLSVANSAKFWKSISFAGLKYAILGRIPGTVAGGMLLLWIDQRALALWLGISVIAAVALESVERDAKTHVSSDVLCRLSLGIYGHQFFNWRATHGVGTATRSQRLYQGKSGCIFCGELYSVPGDVGSSGPFWFAASSHLLAADAGDPRGVLGRYEDAASDLSSTAAQSFLDPVWGGWLHGDTILLVVEFNKPSVHK